MAGNVVRILITTNEAPAVAGLGKVKAEGMTLSSVMKTAGAGVALGLGVATIAIVKMTSEFQGSMERLHTQAGVSQDSIKGLGDSVLKLSGQVAQDPNSLADALYHIESSFASTGITGAKALALLKVAAQGATIGHANLVDVTNALDAAVVSGIPGVENLSQAMGVLNATVGAGDMSMQDLANAFSTGMVATVKGFGLSIQDIGAAMATLGDNNMRGQVAANNFRQAVQAMAMPVKGGAKALAELGMQTDTLAKDMQKGGLKLALSDLVDHLNAAGISAEQQGEIITQAFGRKAGTALNILVAQYDRVQSKYAEMTKGANSFADSWTQTTHTLQFQLSAFADGAKAAGISVGEALIPAISQTVGILKLGFPLIQGAANAFNAIPGPIRSGALSLGVFAMAVKLLGPALSNVGTKLRETGAATVGWVSSVRQAETFSGKFSAALGGMSSGLSKAGMALIALNMANQAFSAESGAKGVDTTAKALLALQRTGHDTSGTLKNLDFDLGNLGTAGRGAGAFVENFTGFLAGDHSIKNVDERVASLDQTLANMATSGHAVDAAAVFKTLTERAKEQGTSVDVLRNAFPQYTNALDASTAATVKQISATASLDVANTQLTTAQQDLTDALDASKNAMLGLMGSEDAYYAAIQTATDAVKTNGVTLDVHTDKGRANRKALEDLAGAGMKWVQNLRDQGSSVSAVDAALRSSEGAFMAAAQKMGLTKVQAAALKDQIYGDADAASAATGNLQDMVNTLGRLKSKVLTLTVTAIGNGLALLNRPGSDIITTVNATGSSVGRAMKASGGVSGAESGGSRGSVTMVGEHGPELVELPYGSMVRSNPDTQRMLSGGGGGGQQTITLEVVGNDPAMVDLIRRLVRVRGGNVQTVFGR